MPIKRVPHATVAALAAAMLLATPAAAGAGHALPLGKAKALAAKKAAKVRRQLRSEGARRSKVPGCWRNNERQVSCFFSIYGYDAEQDFRWKCMLRIVVKLRERPSPAGRRYGYSYGHAVCG